MQFMQTFTLGFLLQQVMKRKQLSFPLNDTLGLQEGEASSFLYNFDSSFRVAPADKRVFFVFLHPFSSAFTTHPEDGKGAAVRAGA